VLGTSAATDAFWPLWDVVSRGTDWTSHFGVRCRGLALRGRRPRSQATRCNNGAGPVWSGLNFVPRQRAIGSGPEPQRGGSDKGPHRHPRTGRVRHRKGRPSGRTEKVANTDDVTADLQCRYAMDWHQLGGPAGHPPTMVRTEAVSSAVSTWSSSEPPLLPEGAKSPLVDQRCGRGGERVDFWWKSVPAGSRSARTSAGASSGHFYVHADLGYWNDL